MPSNNALVTVDPRDPEGRRVIHTGPIANVVQYLARVLNFTYTNVTPRDGGFGAKIDGSWTGMIGMVQREEADIAIGPVSHTKTRDEAADFAWPLWYDSSVILAGLGRPEIDPWGFLQPLAPWVWVGVLASLLAVPLAEFLCSSWLSVNASTWGSWLTNTLEYVRILLQQDPYLRAVRWWERLVMLVWMLVTLVLTRSYSGNLVALLAVRHISQPYQTLHDVLDDPSAIMMWQKNSINAEYFPGVKAKLEPKGRLMYITQGEYFKMVDSLVRRGRHILFDVGINLRNLIAKDYSLTGRCDFYTSRETYLAFSSSLISHKNSPIVPAVKYRMLALAESGIFVRWFKTSVANSTVCLHPPQQYVVQSSLNLTNLWGMLVVVMCGSGVSLLVLCVEVFSSSDLHMLKLPKNVNPTPEQGFYDQDRAKLPTPRPEQD